MQASSSPVLFTTAAIAAAGENKRVLAQKAHVAELDHSGLILAATTGKGAVKAQAAMIVAEKAWQDTVAQFRKSGCTNVAPFARFVRTFMGTFMDTKNLPACPMGRQGFADYPAAVAAWVESATSDKTKAARAAVLDRVRFVVDSAAAIHAEHTAAQASAALTVDTAQALADAGIPAGDVQADSGADESESARVNADADALAA